MTECEWQSCTDPEPMLEYLATRATDRKLRLFACACARRAWDALTEQPSRRAVEVSERYADDLATADELEQSWAAASRVAQGALARLSRWDLLAAAKAEARDAARGGAWAAAHSVVGDEISAADRQAAADLLRHLFPNPFGTPAAPPSVSPAVAQLAEAIYGGDATASAPLNTALAEAGHPELAAHFHDETAHPKGCWVVDLLTGRT